MTSALHFSVELPPSDATPGLIRTAERLGFDRAWLYDSPALYDDVWSVLIECARQTTTIGLGPGVLVPPLRHPMVNAAAIARLRETAGTDRVAIAVGTGFTGALTLGRAPFTWNEVVEHVQCVRSLLRGDTATWDGSKIRMLHEGYVPSPIPVPFVFAAMGPRGTRLAKDLADGVMGPFPCSDPAFDWDIIPFRGTLLDPGEDVNSERVIGSAGPGAVMTYHTRVGLGRALHSQDDVEFIRWLDAYADVPADELHLAIHERHLTGINHRDTPFVTGDLIRATRSAWTASELRAHLEGFASGGATEIMYNPGPENIEAEMERFITAARS